MCVGSGRVVEWEVTSADGLTVVGGSDLLGRKIILIQYFKLPKHYCGQYHAHELNTSWLNALFESTLFNYQTTNHCGDGRC